jgi:putative transcriptional regulator
MSDETDYENLSVFEQIKMGLEQALAHGRGELTLKTTTLPLPPRPIARTKLIALRKKLGMSQSIFAAALNASTKLVQSWEQGIRKPDRGDLRLIEILSKQPELVSNLILGNEEIRPSSKNGRKHATGSKAKASAA